MTDFLIEYRHLILPLHIFATTLGLGGAIVTDFLFMKFLKDFKVSPEEKEVLDNLSLVIWGGLGLLILTGLALFWPFKMVLLQTPVYQLKLITVSVILINGLFLNYYVSPKLTSIFFNQPGLNSPQVNRVRKISPVFGGISIISWTTTFFLGALSSSLDYSFSTLLGVYLILLLVGIFSTLGITRYKFRSKIN